MQGYEMTEEEVRISLDDFRTEYSGPDGLPEYASPDSTPCVAP